MPRKIISATFITLLFGCLFEFGSETFSIAGSYVFSSIDSETVGVIKSSEIRRPKNIIARKADFEYEISYAYSVGGVEYVGTRVKFDIRFINAREIFNKYPVGSQVVVYYDSSNPSFSVLENGLGNTVMLQLLALTLLFIMLLIF